MEHEVSSAANELSDTSDDDQSVMSLISSKRINSSFKPLNQSLKSWVEPVRSHLWTDLAKCMRFISKHGCTKNRSPAWIRRTLNPISSTATPEQLIHILNGYADLDKLVLYLIKVNANAPVHEENISSFGGTSRSSKQQKRRRNVAFIMYNSDNFLFAPLYATGTDGRPQTCFATDDEKIVDHISELLRRLNDEVQRSVENMDQTNIDNDATEKTEVTEKTDTLDALLFPDSVVQNEPIIITSKTSENDIQHIPQSTAQLDLHANGIETDTQLNRPIANDLNSSHTDLTTKNVQHNLDHMEALLKQAKYLQGQVDDMSSKETDDRQRVISETVEEHESISKSGMTNISKSTPVHKKKHVRCSSHNRALSPIGLAPSTTEPTPIMISNDQNMSEAVEQDEPPNITKQPKPYRRVRMLTDLAKNKCPLIQAGEGKSQRSYPEIEVSPDRNQDFCVSVKAVTENKYPHPLTTVAPENASVDWTLKGEDNNERVCLKYDPESFNAELACVYLPITDKERKKRSKQIKVRLLNWKQFGPMLKEVVERENPQLCRLELHWCKRVGPGKYQLVSRPSYTTVIEQENGDVFICSDKIEPKQLCELGGERVIIPLSTVFLKKDFSIECNDDVLKSAKFTVKRKQLLFTSPPKPEGKDELHLIIKRKEYIKNTATLEEYELHEDYLPYVTHDSDKCRHR